MKIVGLFFLLLSLPLSASNGVEFFQTLKLLCGKQMIGKTVYPDDPEHDFANKKLVMEVTSCTDNEIRIPFRVGEDTSRTWIFTLNPQGLLLKHDHRYKDGTPHKLTMYGGWADDKGTASKQSFPADKETYILVPEGKTNIWTVSYDPSNKQFVYYLTRHKKPRYKAVFEFKPEMK